ncbi:MAG: hypothetical protein COV96_00845 [Candidatus Zambryskibacteria bacterium CG11_big_fil_rev_8_21_14_0_20_42_18]|uniref:Putative pre-16S rRNA nuclease n=1 Tax=Candidatus Zambryskibacteria bacterium CG_4_9_14_3_um_filter_42_15 TaxID=1975112 RepID=A0A2M7WSM3_9BACT|nr:MAG: hypothetical protein COV96_00845 [Candidatus Zambryskibacteria bacterium CG11_big_fil_rev_8_21_14_0_20_42_18]PJA32999.1 MAG: hypothetical protein CO185_01045 [Candidatus Zambryskibacteria bacterium CG_4_9_14_3_um_filter_42_15]
MTKLMAIDYGTKRVGIALSDDSQGFALPYAVWANDRELLNKVLELKEKEDVGTIVMGESKNLDGRPNKIQTEIAKFKAKLEEKGIGVIFQPEIFTTVEARRDQGQTKMTDASAAALILKSFIDTVYNKEV